MGSIQCWMTFLLPFTSKKSFGNFGMSGIFLKSFSLLGHNGAGKTTLVNILTGLVSLTEGTFYYNENEIFSNMSRLQESIGFCAQHDFSLENNTVYENLEFFAEIKNVPKERVKAEVQRVLEKFNLGKFEHTQASQLSSGWKRKLNVAIALLNDPNIIIMDEPTSGMDPVTRREYWEIICKLKEEKKTVVITTQFLDEAEKLCDRLAILSKGRLFAVGSVDYIKKKFGTGYNLIIESNNTAEKLEDRAFEITTKIHNITPKASRHDDFTGNMLKYLLPFSEQNKFAELFSELEKIPGIQMNLQLISLEEAFVKLELNSDRIIGKNNYSDEFKARLSSIPSSFYEEKVGNVQDHIKAILMQRLYRLKVDSKEKWALFASMSLFGVTSGWYLYDINKYRSDSEYLTAAILLASSLLPPIFISSVCNDRVKKVRYLLKVQGVKPFAYWLAQLIGDFVLQIPLIILVIFMFNKDPKLKEGQIYQFILMYLSFAVNLTTFSYNLSLKFKSPELSWIGGPVTTLGSIVLAALIGDATQICGFEIYQYVFLASCFVLGPSPTFFLGVSRILNPLDDIGKGTMYTFAKPWPYNLVLLLTGIIDFCLVVYRDSQVIEPHEKKRKKAKESVEEEVEDENTVEGIDEKALTVELQRLISRSNKDVVKVLELQKTYKNGCKALRGLDFGVEEDQIFCLLGVNGAGKTTCLDILTNNLTQTAGTIEIEGQDILTFYENKMNRVGVCCQINTLWKELTVRQHLQIFTRINGIHGVEADQAIQYLLDSLQLESYSQQKISELSMGTQRKLCVAVSVIGAPRILFLDEPSTGIDPVGRNQIWDLIKTVVRAKQGSMILTTHYMQEAELVGDKLGILINGGLQTIGTLASLKKKHGDYMIVIKMATERGTVGKAVEFVFPEAVREEPNNSKANELVFKVPANVMRFSKIFEVLAASKADGEIEDFSIYTTTLEQIFVRLVKEQVKRGLEEEGDGGH